MPPCLCSCCSFNPGNLSSPVSNCQTWCASAVEGGVGTGLAESELGDFWRTLKLENRPYLCLGYVYGTAVRTGNWPRTTTSQFQAETSTPGRIEHESFWTEVVTVNSGTYAVQIRPETEQKVRSSGERPWLSI